MKLSPTQLRVLRYASEGRLVRRHYEAARKTKWRLQRRKPGERTPADTSVQPLFAAGLLRVQPSGHPILNPVVVTPKGAALLAETAEQS